MFLNTLGFGLCLGIVSGLVHGLDVSKYRDYSPWFGCFIINWDLIHGLGIV